MRRPRTFFALWFGLIAGLAAFGHAGTSAAVPQPERRASVATSDHAALHSDAVQGASAPPFCCHVDAPVADPLGSLSNGAALGPADPPSLAARPGWCRGRVWIATNWHEARGPPLALSAPSQDRPFTNGDVPGRLD